MVIQSACIKINDLKPSLEAADNASTSDDRFFEDNDDPENLSEFRTKSSTDCSTDKFEKSSKRHRKRRKIGKIFGSKNVLEKFFKFLQLPTRENFLHCYCTHLIRFDCYLVVSGPLKLQSSFC